MLKVHSSYPVHRTRNVVARAAYQPNKYARLTEAVSGRSAMYGVILGGTNWAITGLDVIDQTHYIPFALLALGTVGLSTATTLDAHRRLTKNQFESFAQRKLGRLAMLVFGCMFVGSLLN